MDAQNTLVASRRERRIKRLLRTTAAAVCSAALASSLLLGAPLAYDAKGRVPPVSAVEGQLFAFNTPTNRVSIRFNASTETDKAGYGQCVFVSAIMSSGAYAQFGTCYNYADPDMKGHSDGWRAVVFYTKDYRTPVMRKDLRFSRGALRNGDTIEESIKVADSGTIRLRATDKNTGARASRTISVYAGLQRFEAPLPELTLWHVTGFSHIAFKAYAESFGGAVHIRHSRKGAPANGLYVYAISDVNAGKLKANSRYRVVVASPRPIRLSPNTFVIVGAPSARLAISQHDAMINIRKEEIDKLVKEGFAIRDAGGVPQFGYAVPEPPAPRLRNMREIGF